MQNSRLIKVISHLSKYDKRALKKFLRSPYFNQRQDVIVLFEEISIVLQRKNPIWNPTEIYKIVYPGKAYQQQQLRLVMSYLLQLIEQYLFIQEVEKDKGQAKLLIARAYQNRNLPTQRHRNIKDGIQLIEKKDLRNAQWYQQVFQLQLEQLQLEASNTPTDTLNRQQLSDTLDISFLISKLRLTILLLSHQAVYKSNYEIHLLEEIILFLKGHDYLKIPAIAIYYHSYFIVSDQEKGKHFTVLKQLLLSHGDIFATREIGDLYLLAINHCIKQINKGNDQYYSEALELYRKGLEKKYLLVNQILSRFTYHNIVKAGIKTENYDWVEFFINHYKNNLERKFRESSVSFSLGQLEYSRKNYNAALLLLQKANYRDLLLNLASKATLLKIYYETKEFDLLESHLEAMKNFIRRKRVIGYHQTNYLNIVKYTSKLLSTNQFDTEEKNLLRKTIEATEPLTEKDWLLAQI